MPGLWLALGGLRAGHRLVKCCTDFRFFPGVSGLESSGFQPELIDEIVSELNCLRLLCGNGPLLPIAGNRWNYGCIYLAKRIPSPEIFMTLSNSCSLFRRYLAISGMVTVLAFLMALPLRAETNEHIVSNHALQQQVQSASGTREQNIQTVDRLFSTPLAKQAMKMEHVSPTQVKNAIPTLSDSELANLSSRANQAEQQFSAGNLSTSQMLLLIIVLLIVVILVAVH